MNKAVGIVSEARGTSVVVDVDVAACPRCQAGQGCGAGIFTAGQRRVTLTVPADEGLSLRPGDAVQLSLPPGRLIRAVLLLYGLPLAALLLVCGIAYLTGQSEIATIALALIALCAGFVAAGWSSRRDACLSDLRPTASERAVITDPERFS